MTRGLTEDEFRAEVDRLVAEARAGADAAAKGFPRRRGRPRSTGRSREAGGVRLNLALSAAEFALLVQESEVAQMPHGDLARRLLMRALEARQRMRKA